MRFISKYRSYKAPDVVPMEWDVLANGSIRVLKQGTNAEFKIMPLHPWEKQAARDSFSFTGLTTELDGTTPIDPVVRVSLYDTENEQITLGWPDEIRDQVEQNLLKAFGYGQDFIRVEKPPVAKPWPSYDDFGADAQKIAAFCVEAGIDPAAVLEYERENANRKAVIAAVERIDEPVTVQA